MKPCVSEQLQYYNLLTSEIDEAYHNASLKLGLSDSAMMILYALCSRENPCPLLEIARLTGISRQTIHSAIKKLEAQGILTLESPGGRRKLVRLTEEGMELAEKTAGRLIKIENEIFDSWTGEELEQYIRLTGRYLEQFRERPGGLAYEDPVIRPFQLRTAHALYDPIHYHDGVHVGLWRGGRFFCF